MQNANQNRINTTSAVSGQPTAVAIASGTRQVATANRAPEVVTGVILPDSSLPDQVAAFLRSLSGRNLSPATLVAYRSDLLQLVAWLQTSYSPDIRASEILASDLEEYLAALADRKLSGVSRARKLAPIREFFRYLVRHGLLAKSPAEHLETPKKGRQPRVWLATGEYKDLLAQASGNARDVAILQLFIQTGLRVAELCSLRVDDIDLPAKLIRVRGKGGIGREIPLERKAIEALRTWIKARSKQTDEEHLFLNYQEEPLGDRGVRKLLAKYVARAGITKKTSPHTLRRTFATHKSQKGVPLRQIQEMLGHADLKTTSFYIGNDQVELQRVQEATSL